MIKNYSKYSLNAFIGNENIFLEIGKDKYDEIRISRDNYFEILKIEEIYFNLLKNYKEFEMSLFERAVDSILFRDYTWDTFKEKIHEFDRRIFNFLAQARLFFDLSSRIIKKVYGRESDEIRYFERLRSSNYDSSFSYRLMEAIRNYVQHNDLPVGRINMIFKDVVVDDVKKKTAYTIPYLDIEKILKDKNFKMTVKKELDINTKEDLRAHMREYISKIMSIHYMFNEHQKLKVQNDLDQLNSLIEYYKEYTVEKIWWIEVIGNDEEDKNFTVSYETLDRYNNLVNKGNTYIKFEDIVIII